MQERLALVSDDPDTFATLPDRLARAGYRITALSDPRDLLAGIGPEDYDLVLADLRLAFADGVSFVRTLRERAPLTAVLCLGPAYDEAWGAKLIAQAGCEWLPRGVADSLLEARLERLAREARDARRLTALDAERKDLLLELDQLKHWRSLYAAKDHNQTEELLRLLTRLVNADGGFMWLDLIEALGRPDGEGSLSLPSEVVGLIRESGGNLRSLFGFLTYVDRLDSLELCPSALEAARFAAAAADLLERELRAAGDAHGRPWRVQRLVRPTAGLVDVDLDQLAPIVRELVCNAIKYSPSGTPLMASVECGDRDSPGQVRVTLRNEAREMQARDARGDMVWGIPFDHAERVFDLFYRIESYPCLLPDEAWPHGAGLYICRKLLRRQGAWIRADGGIDQGEATPAPFVRITMSFPVRKEDKRPS